jgi:glycosyltransferase involved in cell wall biosynthesis
MSLPYSVVMPSHQRGDVVIEVLDALDAQRGAPDFEIVVVDDGSSEAVRRALRAWRGKRPYTLLEQPQAGPAVARNRGVGAARGERIALLGDDTVPEPDWLATHAAAHARYGGGDEIAVLGKTCWHRRMRRTLFLDYLNESGLQFGYALIRDPEHLPFNFFAASNISLDRARLLAEPFDESFPYPAWEDTEASYRLTRKGMRMVFEPAALNAHDHPTDYARFARRQERAGYCGVVFYLRHPELVKFVGLEPGGPPPLPPLHKHGTRELIVRTLQNLPVSLPRLWRKSLRYHYIRGLQRGWRELVTERKGVPGMPAQG